MECTTLANDIISMYSTNMIIGLILFTGFGVSLGIIFGKGYWTNDTLAN
jgi:hypothetical protein